MIGGATLAGCAPRRPIVRLTARLGGLGVRVCLAAPVRSKHPTLPLGRPASAELAHRALRQLLTGLTQGRVAAEAWMLGRSRSGGPLVRGPESGFHASIAYTRQIFAVAVASGRRIGVDLEPDAPLPEEEIPLHLLSPGEAAHVREDEGTFLTIWTLKEALAKERGDGLLADCSTIDAAAYARAESFAVVPRPDGGKICHVRFRSGNDPYRFALALGPLQR